MKTTLRRMSNNLRSSPFAINKLLTHLGKTKVDDEPLPLLLILDVCRSFDAITAMMDVEGYNDVKRLYAIWCARQVEHLMIDPGLIAAIEAAQAYCDGHMTLAGMTDARAEAVRIELANPSGAARVAVAACAQDAALAAYYCADIAATCYAVAASGAAGHPLHSEAFWEARNDMRDRQGAQLRTLL